MRSRRVFRLSWNLPLRERPQMNTKPRNWKVSGFPSPRLVRLSAAWPAVRARAPVTRAPDPVSGACFARSRSSWSPPFAPPAPQHRRIVASALFVGFPATMAECDFSRVVHHRLRLLAFPTRTGSTRDFRAGEPRALPVPAQGVSDRGRDAGYPAPPAQIRTGPIKAYGSHLGCVTAKRMLGHG